MRRLSVLIRFLLYLSMGDSCINDPQLSLYRYVALSFVALSRLQPPPTDVVRWPSATLTYFLPFFSGSIMEEVSSSRDESIIVWRFSLSVCDHLWHDVLSLRRFRWILDDDFRFHRFHESNSAMDIEFLRILLFPLFLIGNAIRHISMICQREVFASPVFN